MTGTPAIGAVRRVEVTVDEVVLRGVAHERSWEVAAALEAGLHAAAESSRQAGELPSARSEASRRLPTLVVPDATPAALGSGVAAAVWSVIGGGNGVVRRGCPG